jgi:hypothetical protein
MRWRLIVLGCLAVAMAVGCLMCGYAATDLAYRAQQVFGDVQQNPPTPEEQAASNRMSQESWGLQLLMTPLAAGSLISALAVPAILGRRWQLRETAEPRGRKASARASRLG